MTEFALYAATLAGQRLTSINDYESATLVARVNQPGKWTITLPASSWGAQQLLSNVKNRLEVTADYEGTATPGSEWFSGPITEIERTYDADGDWVTVSGASDLVWLARRIVLPGQIALGKLPAYDVRTGPASQVLAAYVDYNAGPGAPSGNRRVSGLTVPVPAALGPTITRQGRFQNLLEWCLEIATNGDLIFDIVGLQFVVGQATDKGVVFSEDMSNLAGWHLIDPAPTANATYVAGQGEAGDRWVAFTDDPTSRNAWGYVEQFVDRRDIATPDGNLSALRDAGQEVLVGTVIPPSLELAAIETPTTMFRRDWNLGDVVTVKLPNGVRYSDTIVEVQVKIDGMGTSVVPVIGRAISGPDFLRRIAVQAGRIRQLERV